MGLGLSFAEGEGPRFERTTDDERTIAALAVPDLARLRYVFDAVRRSSTRLPGSVPLIGFAGSPFTLACYMIEGGGSADFATVRKMAYARPDLLDRLVAINADAVAAYLREQVTAGVDAVMLFDTWGGLLPAADYRRFSLGPMRTVLDRLPQQRADDPVHQERRQRVTVDRRIRGLVRGPRLDGRPARRAARFRRPRRVPGQPRPDRAVDRSGHGRTRRAARSFATPARSQASSSTSATASCRPRRLSTSPRSWTPCMPPRRHDRSAPAAIEMRLSAVDQVRLAIKTLASSDQLCTPIGHSAYKASMCRKLREWRHVTHLTCSDFLWVVASVQHSRHPTAE